MKERVNAMTNKLAVDQEALEAAAEALAEHRIAGSSRKVSAAVRPFVVSEAKAEAEVAIAAYLACECSPNGPPLQSCGSCHGTGSVPPETGKGDDALVERVLERLCADWGEYLEPDKQGWRREIRAALTHAGLLGSGATGVLEK